MFIDPHTAYQLAAHRHRDLLQAAEQHRLRRAARATASNHPPESARSHHTFLTLRFVRHLRTNVVKIT